MPAKQSRPFDEPNLRQFGNSDRTWLALADRFPTSAVASATLEKWEMLSFEAAPTARATESDKKT